MSEEQRGIGSWGEEQRRTGSWGEDAAMEWLREQGFYIVERNWRVGHYEIDIIAQRWDTLHFVEVKTRREGALVSPAEVITPRKVRNLISAANHFIQANAIDTEAFLDLVTVEIDPASGEMNIELIPDIANCRW